MSFEVNGSKGIYDGKVQDDSVRYGRNAVANHRQMVIENMAGGISGEAPMLDFEPTEKALDNNIQKVENFVDENDAYIDSLPPINYEYRYMPSFTDGNIDKKALYGAAYEEMGSPSMPVKNFEEKFLPDDSFTAEPLDINKDGNIDVAEYGASMLAADMLSKENPSVENIDGSINSKGMTSVMEYSKKSRAAAAAKLYSQIYNKYSLDKAV